jgi:hypothetical protein
MDNTFSEGKNCEEHGRRRGEKNDHFKAESVALQK